jgi:hypothetical protein
MSETVEEKFFTTVNNGTNNTEKAERDMIAIGQQKVKNILFPISSSETVEKIEGMQNNQQTKHNGAIWFGVIKPVTSFTGREKELNELHKLVKVKRELTAISQIAIVSGAEGIGKSELARKYAYIHREDFDNNIAWINAETQESLQKSFIMLAKDLRIPTTEEREEKEQNKDIKFIVKDVYKCRTKVESLYFRQC